MVGVMAMVMVGLVGAETSEKAWEDVDYKEEDNFSSEESASQEVSQFVIAIVNVVVI